MNGISTLIMFVNVYFINTVKGVSTNSPSGSSPTRPNEVVNSPGRLIGNSRQGSSIAVAEVIHQGEPNKDRRLTEYQKKRQRKVANLEKVGVDTNVARIVVNQHLSNYRKDWMKANSEKGKKIRKESYSRRYNIIKDERNEKRRKRYSERKSTESDFVRSRRKTAQDRYEANVRSNVKKGMTQAQAKEEAVKYMDNYNLGSRERAQRRRQEMKRKASQQEDRVPPNQDQA